MLTPDSLMPHSVCWAIAPRLIWTMVITNAITFVSYLTIALTLIYLVRRTKRIIVGDWAWFVTGFALFILACGSTHLLEVITTWNPIFWVDAWTNIVTAVLSACVAIMLMQRIKKVAFGINDYAGRLDNAQNEKVQLQESLLAAQKLEDWSRMSAAVSHEIKNPLQAIQNLQFLIRNTEGIPPQIAQLAQLAEQEAGRVLNISESTLTFIRQASEPERIDLREAVQSVQFLLAPLIREKEIQLQVESSGDTTVQAFAGETRQVLLNLVRNACEATVSPVSHPAVTHPAIQSDTRVTVELIGKPSGVEVVVTDHGAGIAPDILPSIFQFGTTTKGHQGNGMGLWTVKHIVNKHRGEVKVHSTPGQGTRIDLWWPRAYA